MRVRIEVASVDAESGPGHWRVAWQVHNLDVDALTLEDAWIPHGRFRGVGHIPLAIRVESGASVPLELPVRTNEPPRTIVENAFLILRLRARATRWRVFVRMTVTFDAEARPRPVVESVSTQSIQ